MPIDWVNEGLLHTNAPIAENKYQNRNLKGTCENQTIHPALLCGQHRVPLLINNLRSAFSAPAPTIPVIICGGRDVPAPAFNHEQHFRRQRNVASEPNFWGLEYRRQLDSPNRP